MKLFKQREVREAIAYAQAGGQALHLFKAMPNMPAPRVFGAYPLWGHLIDYDEARLVETARRLGVRKIVVGRKGRRGQHVDLCGAPLERAIREAGGVE